MATTEGYGRAPTHHEVESRHHGECALSCEDRQSTANAGLSGSDGRPCAPTWRPGSTAGVRTMASAGWRPSKRRPKATTVSSVSSRVRSSSVSSPTSSWPSQPCSSPWNKGSRQTRRSADSSAHCSRSNWPMQMTGRTVVGGSLGDDAVRHLPNPRPKPQVAGHGQAKQGNLEVRIRDGYACGNDPGDDPVDRLSVTLREAQAPTTQGGICWSGPPWCAGAGRTGSFTSTVLSEHSQGTTTGVGSARHNGQSGTFASFRTEGQ